jgi:Flp pilus assembly protein TadG
MMEKRNTTLHEHNKGQSLVEFALVIPLLVLVIAGLFDLGRAFYSLITITNAAREGARYGTLNVNWDEVTKSYMADTQGICDATWREAQSSGINLNYNEILISCNTDVSCSSSGTTAITCPRTQPITVTVSYNYDDIIFQFIVPDGIQLQRQVEMLVP